MCDRIVIMARGKVRLNAKPQDLMARHRAIAPLVVQLKGDPAAAKRVVSGAPGVTSVELLPSSDPAWSSLLVRGTGSGGVLEEAVAAAATSAGLAIRELARQAPSLERIFLELIESDEGDGGKA